MSRVKISEYRAKKLILGDAYKGVSVTSGSKVRLLSKGSFVVKVDQGVKQRFKKGLLFLDRSPAQVPDAILALKKKGYQHFLVEPYQPHGMNTEHYLSFDRVRGGIKVLYAADGGIEIESHKGTVKEFLIRNKSDVVRIAHATHIPEHFLENLYTSFEKNYFAFLEINPLVVENGHVKVLDAAALVDSAAAFFMNEWTENDIVQKKLSTSFENSVEELAKTSPASFKLTVLNPNGKLFFLLSGGGGSIVIADQAALRGCGKEIGNYGEYSGGPSREETYLYAREVIKLSLASKAKDKRLIIAGGVANFTDVKATFLGIIDALSEYAPALRKAGMLVFVRRGGPNEAAGLELMKEFLQKEKILGSVHGSDSVITLAVNEAIDSIV